MASEQFGIIAAALTCLFFFIENVDKELRRIYWSHFKNLKLTDKIHLFEFSNFKYEIDLTNFWWILGVYALTSLFVIYGS